MNDKQYNFQKKTAQQEQPQIMVETKEQVTEKVLAEKPKSIKKLDPSKSVKQSVYIRIAQSGKSSAWSLPKSNVTNVTIDGEETQATIRYIKGVKSILLEEQGELGDDKSSIIFNGGELYVKGDMALEKYLDSHSLNRSNPNRDTYSEPLFYKQDIEELNTKRLKRFDSMDNAVTLFKQMEINDMKAIAISIPSMRGHVSNWEVSELKYAMRSFIETNPEEFLRVNSDPRTKIALVLSDANKFNVIDTASSSNRVTWHGTKSVILEIPVGFDSISYMADWIVMGEGKTAYADIKKQVEKLY